jgi:hypothetical protein
MENLFCVFDHNQISGTADSMEKSLENIEEGFTAQERLFRNFQILGLLADDSRGYVRMRNSDSL